MRIKLESLLLAVVGTAVVGSGVGYGKVWILHIAFLLFVFGYILVSLQSRISLLHKPRQIEILMLCVFLLWYFLSLAWSINIFYGLRYLFYISFGLSLTFLICSYATTWERYRKLYRIVGVFSIIALIVGMLEGFTSFRLPTSPYSPYASMLGRQATNLSEFDVDVVQIILGAPTSFWGNPNHFAVAAAMISPFFMLNRRRIWGLLGFSSVVIVIIMTGSRGVFIAFCFGIVLRSIFLKPTTLLALSGLLLVFATFLPTGLDLAQRSDNRRVAEMAAVGDALFQYLAGDLEASSGSIGVRQELIRNGISALMDTNGLGVGSGGSQAVQEAAGGTTLGVTSMHNFWVEVLVDGGFFGFGLFVIFYLTLSIRLFLVQARTCSKHIRFNARSLFISLGIFSIGCISTSSVIYFPPMWILFGLAISVIKLSSGKVTEVAPCESIPGIRVI